MAARVFVCFLALSVCIDIGTAQTSVPKAKFAFEIPGDSGLPPSFLIVSNGCSSLLFYDASLHRLPNPEPNTRRPSGLSLEYSVADDAVSITATVFYGDFDRQATPVSLEKLPRETVGTYSGKLNDSVTLSALERVRLELFTLRIVTAQSAHPYCPLSRNNAPSLQIEFASLDRIFGTVTVHNVSNKAVTSLRVNASEEDTISR